MDLKNISKEKIINSLRGFSPIARTALRWLLPASVLALVFYFIYIWYSCVYSPNWNEEKKSAYRNAMEKEVPIDSAKFDSAISELQKRRDAFQAGTESAPDIFRLK